MNRDFQESLMHVLPCFARVLLLAAASATTILAGCASSSSPSAAASAGTPANVDLRVVIAEGTVNGFDFGSGTAPINFSVAPDPAKNYLCGVISEADAAAARATLARDGITVLSAPRIIAASGKPASIQVGDDQGATMKLDVTATAADDGTLRVKVSYSSGTAGPGFPETTFALKLGQSIVAVARDATPGEKAATSQTLLITPAIAPPAEIAAAR
jgi:hypothetical protein